MQAFFRFSSLNLFLFILFISISEAQEELIDWHQQGNNSEFPTGIGSADWYTATNIPPVSKIVVAILDTGVDIEHPDLQPNIWINPDEVGGNNKDDDGNGYIDDVYGWNFLGGPDGQSVFQESLEATRVYAQGKAKWENVNPEKLKARDKKEYEKYLEIKEFVESKRESAETIINEAKVIEETVISSLEAAKKELDGDTLDVRILELSDNEEVQIAAKIIRSVEEQGVVVESIDWLIDIAQNQFKEQIREQEDDLYYKYNPDYNSRTITGDIYSDFTNRHYGNNDVDGEFSYHGTHVAGIVGAVRDNGIGMNGISDNVAIMSIRLVPDGDERDKDVANGIIYAVDNGAEVINMSFGKGYSPEKNLVDNAMKYAAKKDVLLVLGAGNESTDIDNEDRFPTDIFFGKSKSKIKNLISVGALAPDGGEAAVAEFSNYGKNRVDIFAPGVYIYSTTPDSTYDYASGTSMAAPVVSGAAALIRSRYPKLSAAQVKDILIKSAHKLPAEVIQPGTYEKISSSELSVSGGIIDLPAAMKLAASTKGKRKASTMPAAYVRPIVGSKT